MKLQYNSDNSTYEVDFKKVSKNIVEITGDFPVKECGFTLSRTEKNDNWDYSSYTTIYREVEGGVQFSNDGSVYVEPIIPTPTAEELAEMEERERIANIENEISELKAKLNASDYKVIKCFECSMVGKEMPYDVNELHAERQAIRDEINLLEYTL